MLPVERRCTCCRVGCQSSLVKKECCWRLQVSLVLPQHSWEHSSCCIYCRSSGRSLQGAPCCQSQFHTHHNDQQPTANKEKECCVGCLRLLTDARIALKHCPGTCHRKQPPSYTLDQYSVFLVRRFGIQSTHHHILLCRQGLP